MLGNGTRTRLFCREGEDVVRPMTIVGALLIAAGLYIIFSGASFTKDKTVFKAGPIEANVKEQQGVPTWAGAVAIVLGVGCVVVGVRKA
jgi:hypothetical protein